jgi:cell division septum initiation protein DivIVA
MENKRGKSMNEKNTDHLLKLLDDLIKLVGKNTDNINRLAQEIADLKAKK